MNTIQEKWASYRRECVPANAGPVQVEECRRAFYAGSAGMLNLLCTEVPDMDEAAGVQVIEGLHEECRGFVRTVGSEQ